MVPAILRNVAAPLCLALKLSMLGHASDSPRAATASMAAYAGVSAVVEVSASILNLVIEASVARVQRARSANDVHELATAIRSTAAAAAGIGCLFAAVLWLCREHMLDLTYVSCNLEAASIARDYAPYALAALPPCMLLAACRFILVEFGALGTASALANAAVIADTAAFSIPLVHWSGGLPAAAAASLVAALILAAAGLCLVLHMASPTVHRQMLPLNMPGLPAAAWREPLSHRPRHPDAHAPFMEDTPGAAAVNSPLAVNNPSAVPVKCPEAAAVSTPTAEDGSGAEPRDAGECDESRSDHYPDFGNFLGTEFGTLPLRRLFLSGNTLALMAGVGYYGGAPALAAHAVLVQLWMIPR